MCGFPFQTGLSCPSHHQGSLLKYIPSVKGYRVDGMEQWREGRERSEGEVFKATGRPFPRGSVAGRLSPQIQVSFH